MTECIQIPLELKGLNICAFIHIVHPKLHYPNRTKLTVHTLATIHETATKNMATLSQDAMYASHFR